ncbi:MAG TPA: phosphoglycerate dehydrogenase [Chthonomonadaceae bacterium]|nr:phosphoglycerate dehydrogenase [Chthonomonadaceae bacterium]
MPKVLVSDPLAEAGIAKLRAIPGVEVDVRLGLAPEELKSIIGEYEALGVRSETKVTADILAAADKLKIIGRAGVGVDNIDVAAATQKGVVVVNSPDGNTLAAAELTVGLLLALARQIPLADASLHGGKWERKKFVGTEIYGKTVGVIGLGRIGCAVAQRLKGFEVELIAYNPFVTEEATRRMGAEPVSLDDLLRRSDFITIHTPLSDETRNLIDAPQFALMKDGVRIINCARGGIVNEAALADAVRSGKVGGIAFDVFSKEPPPPENPLLSLPGNQSVLTPHLGASTEEAQIKVAVDVCEQIADVLQGRPARTPVNLPSTSAEDMARLVPYQELAAKIGSLQMQMGRATTGAGRAINAVEVIFQGDLGGLPTGPITRAVLKGLMTPLLADPVNEVNAPSLAEARGIKVVESHAPASTAHTCQLVVRAQSPSGEHTICGTVYGGAAHIVHIDGYHVDILPTGNMIVTQHTDRPGVIGRVGTLLGEQGVNIAGMHVGRAETGGRAIMVLLVDDPISPEIMQQLCALPGMETAQLVTL